MPIESIYDGVHTGPVLGSGVSGIVRLVKHRATGLEYAVKSIDLGLIENEEVLAALRNEIYIMCQVDHPNIVRLEEVYESESEIYLVQDVCLGGDLFDRLDEQPDYHYTENQCARLVKQMLSSVRYLHSKKIIHRDLKLENFLFSSVKPDSELKMIDFGLSKHFQFGEVQTEAVGTPYTVAPEVIKGSYDERCDVWSIGIITYLLLSGETPFGGCDGENLLQVRQNILRGSFSFEPEDIWQHVSGHAKDFIETLLIVDYHDRPSAKDAQKHPWLQRLTKLDSVGTSAHGNGLSGSVVKGLVAFKEYSDMRKLLCEVLSFTLLPEQIMDLRGEFEKLDADGDGEISLVELKQVLLENAEAGSLGALTEQEVEDIFNALRVRKTDATIRWHEFIAASLSQCEVDERNLQLTFDRLDTDRKGYITFDDIVDLMGSTGNQSKDELQKMWARSINECKCDVGQIGYEDFLLLMKGQTKNEELKRQGSLTRRASLRVGLQLVPETKLAETSAAEVTPEEQSMSSLPSVHTDEAPISAAKADSPFASPVISRSILVKNRSQSVSESPPVPLVDEEEEELLQPPLFRANTTRALILPGQLRSEYDDIWDETKSPLSVNKQIYRAHREMRQAVMDASKRFEEKRARRATGAGLVMRRGTSGKQEKRERIERELVQTARKRAGRPRKYRTASDLTGMVLDSPTSKGKTEVNMHEGDADILRSR